MGNKYNNRETIWNTFKEVVSLWVQQITRLKKYFNKKVFFILWTGTLTASIWTTILTSWENWQEARVFSSDYNSLVNSFIKQNPAWKKLDGVHYSTSHFWKTNNMPFEAPPLVKHVKEKIIDIGWPQSQTPEDLISLIDILKQNNIDPNISENLLSIMIAENFLTTPSLELVRKILPSWLENTIGSISWKDMSKSAMRVKATFLNDFTPEIKDQLLNQIAEFKIPIASRSRALRIWWEEERVWLFPLYQMIGYENSNDFMTDFLAGKIETKTEVWFVCWVVYVNYLQSLISQKESSLLIEKTLWENPQFSSNIYTRDVYSLIAKNGAYTDKKYTQIANDIQKMTSEIIQIENDIKKWKYISIWKKLTNKTSKLSKKISKQDTFQKIKTLESQKTKKIKQRELLQKELSTYSQKHYTVFKNTLNSVFEVFKKVNTLWAFYPTNANRALWMSEKNGNHWTFDQFMWNLSLAMNGSDELLSVDGDPWKQTQEVISKLDTFPIIYEKWMSKMITLRPQIESYVHNNSSIFDSKFLLQSIHSSVETKYMTLSVMASFAKNNPEMLQKVNVAWKEYTLNMNSKPMEELFEIIVDPKQLWKTFSIKDKESISAFYYNYFMPYLMATVIRNYEMQIVIPEIQKQWSHFSNQSNTILRFATDPFYDLALQWNSDTLAVPTVWDIPQVKKLKKRRPIS